ncbi:MAG: class I SAM-dependent methyltransferase [Patescibacteria group bacterium]|nr:class I SAM-dependent methyltransferase [Patescibacteria group bacterium]
MKDDALKAKVRTWWNDNPFAYLLSVDEEGSWEFFRNVDRKVMKWMSPWAHTKYPLLSNLVDYKALKGKKVLDIACGTGWTTEQFVRAGAEVTAVDLTPNAVELTKKRLQLYGLNATVQEADAESLPFPDESFDYVMAWGFLMHTPDTEKAISEIRRVMKTGGKGGAMMYNKNSIHWRWALWFGKGVLQGKLLKMKPQEIANRYTDGADVGGNMLTKFFTPDEFEKLFSIFKTRRVIVCDRPEVADSLPMRRLPLGRYLPMFVKNWIAAHWGQTAWIEFEK